MYEIGGGEGGLLSNTWWKENTFILQTEYKISMLYRRLQRALAQYRTALVI